MAGKNEADLSSKPVGKLLISLAVPTITAQIVNMLYNIVDRIYIGQGVGKTALTGVGVSFPILILISAFSSLIGMGGAPRASIRMGQKDNDGAERILGNCFVTLLSISLILTVFFRTFSSQLLMMFGASPDTLPYGLAYINIYVLGTVFVQLSLGLNAFITAQGFSRYSMVTVLIGAVSNIILDPIFIFGFGMGVKGAALASVISQALSAFWVLRFLNGKATSLRLRREHMQFSPQVMLPVLALGIAPFIMQSTESLVNIVFNRSLQQYGGDIAVGSMTILTSVMQLVMMPVSGLTQGAQPIISYNYGARNNDRVKKAFRAFVQFACLHPELLGDCSGLPGDGRSNFQFRSGAAANCKLGDADLSRGLLYARCADCLPADLCCPWSGEVLPLFGAAAQNYFVAPADLASATTDFRSGFCGFSR